MIEIRLFPCTSQEYTASKIRLIIIGIRRYHLAVYIGRDHIFSSFKSQIIIIPVPLWKQPFFQNSALLSKFPFSLFNQQIVTTVIAVHSALLADSQKRIPVIRLYINAGAVVHPAMIPHDRLRIAAVPFADLFRQNLPQTPVSVSVLFYDPGPVGIHQIPWFISSGIQVVLLFFSPCRTNQNISLFLIVKIVCIQDLVICYLREIFSHFSIIIGIQHRFFSRWYILRQIQRTILFIFLRILCIIQGRIGRHRARIYGNDIVPGAIRFHLSLKFHVFICLCLPDLQRRSLLNLHILCLDAVCKLFIAVVYRHHRKICFVGIRKSHITGLPLLVGEMFICAVISRIGTAGLRNTKPNPVAVFLIRPPRL